MRRIVASVLIALSLVGLCACEESEQKKAERKLEQANRNLAIATENAKQAAQDLEDLESAWADYQNKKSALYGD